jgi:hypothetical protein
MQFRHYLCSTEWRIYQSIIIIENYTIQQKIIIEVSNNSREINNRS